MDVEQNEYEFTSKTYDRGLFHQKDISESRIEEQDPDVSIRSGSFETRVHKFVMVAAYPYFERMFRLPLLENISNVVKLVKWNEDILKRMIKFAYTGKIVLNINNVQSIFYAADYFQSNELKFY